MLGLIKARIWHENQKQTGILLPRLVLKDHPLRDLLEIVSTKNRLIFCYTLFKVVPVPSFCYS
uniref:Uncharacterized protein n=1 Tax=Anguilla anguilla TaxID=7936 RepID=A0A0E9U555_ANGAN